MWIILLATLTCLFAAQTAEGIKCFECSNERTQSSKHCVDPFTAEITAQNAVPCEGGMCFKRKTIKGDTQVVTRGCMPDNGGGDTCVTKTYLGVNTEFCFCAKEGCNGATTTKKALFLMGILATAAVLLASY